MARYLIALTVAAPCAVAPAQVSGQELTLSGDPQVLVVHTATAGLPPDPASDEGTVYSLSVNEFSDVMVHLDAPMPPGVTLRLQLEPPPGASGAGAVALTTSPQAAVRLVPPGTYAGLGIVYHLSATTAAGVVPLDGRQVTFTVRTAL